MGELFVNVNVHLLYGGEVIMSASKTVTITWQTSGYPDVDIDVLVEDKWGDIHVASWDDERECWCPELSNVIAWAEMPEGSR